ncbi:MAG: hypothetical protein ACKV2U_29315, partial [Bryobacteraceae bacterium]
PHRRNAALPVLRELRAAGHRGDGMDDYLRTMEEWTRARGATYNTSLAEGFRQYTYHPYPTTPLLQELTGEALLW